LGVIIILVGIALGMFIHVGVSGNLGFQGCGTPWPPGFVTPVREDFSARLAGITPDDYTRAVR